MNWKMWGKPVDDSGGAICPFDGIKKLGAAYSAHEGVAVVLEGSGDAIIGTNLDGAVIGTGAIETQENAFDHDGVVAVDSIMHDIVEGFAFGEIARVERFRKGNLSCLPRTNCWGGGKEALDNEGKFAFVVVKFFAEEFWQNHDHASEHGGSIEGNNCVPIAVSMGRNYADAPDKFCTVGSLAQERAGDGDDAIAVGVCGCFDKWCDVGSHSN
jgi:hypothetical protein